MSLLYIRVEKLQSLQKIMSLPLLLIIQVFITLSNVYLCGASPFCGLALFPQPKIQEAVPYGTHVFALNKQKVGRGF